MCLTNRQSQCSTSHCVQTQSTQHSTLFCFRVCKAKQTWANTSRCNTAIIVNESSAGNTAAAQRTVCKVTGTRANTVTATQHTALHLKLHKRGKMQSMRSILHRDYCKQFLFSISGRARNSQLAGYTYTHHKLEIPSIIKNPQLANPLHHNYR